MKQYCEASMRPCRNLAQWYVVCQEDNLKIREVPSCDKHIQMVGFWFKIIGKKEIRPKCININRL